MNSLPPPLPMPSASAFAEARPQLSDDDDIPLGWECANPALQIERWGLEAQAPQQDAR